MSDVDGDPPHAASELPRKWVIAGFGVALLAGICTAMLFVKAQRDAVSKAPPEGAPLAFVDVAPIAIDLNGDGVEDFAAVARDEKMTLAVVAFNGKTLREVWHSEGLSGLERARLVAVGDVVIAIDAGAIAHVLQVRSGRALRDVTLPEPPANVCAAGGAVFLGLTDRRVLVLDAVAGTLRDARPEEGGCARAPWAQSPAPGAPDTRRSYAVTHGKLTVAGADGKVLGVVERR